MDEVKITTGEIITALSRSGYLIESRLINILSDLEYELYPNETYPDPVTNKSREIDIYSISYRTTKNLFLNRSLLIDIQHSLTVECINNPQPAVFFKRTEKKKFTIFGKFKFNKIEQETNEDVNGVDYNFNTFTVGSKKFHYNQIDRCSQYCSFSLKKNSTPKNKEWMASHPDALHDTFNKLYDFIIHRQQKTDEWLKNVFREYEVYLNMKYPVIVFQGDLYEAHEEKGDIKLTKTNHVIFEYNRYDNYSSSLLIDIVTEKYFPTYLELLRKDMNHFKNLYYQYYKDKTLKKERPLPTAKKVVTKENEEIK